MKNVTTMAAAKVAAVATGLAMATSMLSFAPMVHAAALTSTQVQSVLGLLTAFGADSATIANVSASLTGTAVTSGSTTTSTGTSACTFSANLTIGSSGMAVTCLQNALIAGGFSIPAGATGYFGTQTRTAVASWQSSRNIAPAVGYFGALSRAAFNLGGSTSSTTTTTTTTTSTVAGCVAGAAFSTTTGAACTVTSTVAGCAAGAVFSATTGQACSGVTVTTGALTGSGRLTNVSSLGGTTSGLHEGDAATAVVGFSADATGGDVAVQRVDATFTIADGGSANLDRYVSDVSLYLGSTKLASMDPALGDKLGRVWTLRFSGLNGVIRSGTTGNFYVKVTPLSSIGTNESGTVVTPELMANSVRAVGADGISDTYVGTPDISSTFSVTAATTATLTVTAAGDNPNASQIAVSSSTTSGVKLLSFNMKAKNSGVTITDMKVNLATTDGSMSDVVSTVYLMKGSTIVSQKNVSTGNNSAVTFTSINQSIAQDSTTNYSIVVDLRGDAAYADGTTLIASTTVAGWDVSDANGNTVNPTAAAVGSTMTLTATGISVVAGTPTASVTTGLSGKGDTANFAIPFTVTAGDTDVYIGGVALNSATASAGYVTFATTTTSTQGATGQPVSNLAVGNTVSGDTSTYYKVLAGTSRTFTLNAAITATTTGTVTAGYVGIQINGIAYGTVAGAETSFYTSNLDSFKTTNVYVTAR